MSRMQRGSAGSQVLLLLVLLAILGGAGAWNYNRNLAEEEALPRPWKGYSDSDLEAIAGAYRQEIEQYSKQYEQASGRRVASGDNALVGDAAREFARVQKETSTLKRVRRELADREVVLGQLEEEIAYRASLGKGFQLHWQRLTSLD